VSCYVLATPDGHVYACSDRCASDVFHVLAASKPGVVDMHWSRRDRDVFCASCGAALGNRRMSAMVLHKAMTPTARRLYRRVHERWWAECCDR
jgi:hypothetical protein